MNVRPVWPANAHLGPQPAGVLEHPLGLGEAGHRRVRIQPPHGLGVLAEDGRLHVARADHVVRREQEAPALRPRVAAGDRVGQLGHRARGGVSGQQSGFSTAMKWLLPEPNEPCR
jgi:hypothetical protein